MPLAFAQCEQDPFSTFCLIYPNTISKKNGEKIRTFDLAYIRTQNELQMINWGPSTAFADYKQWGVARGHGSTAGKKTPWKLFDNCLMCANFDLGGKKNPFGWFLHPYNFRTEYPKTTHSVKVASSAY